MKPTHRLSTPGPLAVTRTSPPVDPWFDLRALGRMIWSELPVLAAIDLVLTVAISIVALSAMTVPLAAPLVAAVLVGPVWLAATAACYRLLNGGTPGILDFLRSLPLVASDGVQIALLPAGVTTALLGTLAVAGPNDLHGWLMLPVAVDALALVILAFGALSAFSLAVRTRYGGRQRWLVACAIVGKHPVVSTGLLAMAVLLAVAAREIGPFLAVAALGPYCLIVTAVVNGLLVDPLAIVAERADGE